MELNDLIAAYKRAREEKDAAVKKYTVLLDDLSRQIEAKLAEAGLKSARTDAGLVTTYVRRNVKVTDWNAFAQFAESNPALVKQSIDSTEALRLIEDGEVIPGVEVSGTTVLSVK
jgi:hypothetical protein